MTGREWLTDRVATAWRHVVERQSHLNALAYRGTRRALERRKAAERGPADVVDTVLDVQPGWTPYRVQALQHRAEFTDFLEYLRDEDPSTVLELGLFLGGTTYVWARALERTRQVVSVDQPVWPEQVLRGRRALYPTFDADTAIDVVYGDSHAEATYEAVDAALDAPVDVLFVDGDHTYDGVVDDFETYRRLVGEGGVVAFHDIRRHADDRAERAARLAAVDDLDPEYVTVGRPEWGVSEFWADVRSAYDTREFLSHPEQLGRGIGVVEL